MLRAYRDKVAVVTGAGSGLGRALALELGSRGARVALIDCNPSTMAHTAEMMCGQVTCHKADVSCASDVESASAEIIRLHGAVDVLINNAGISISMPFEATPPADFERLIRVNFLGATHACRALLPALRASKGQIMNVASCFAWTGFSGKSAYAASKAALRAFSETLRVELAAVNVGVTLLFPGPLHTNIVRDGLAESEKQRSREESFLSKRGLQIDAVARRSLDALLRNPARIVIGRDYRVIDWLTRLSPALASRMMAVASSRADV